MPYLVLDLETWPRDDARALMRQEAPANYKDPAKIAAYIEEQAELLATDVDLARIAALGYADEGEPAITSPCKTVQGERSAIEALFLAWRLVNAHGDGKLVTFKGLTFDLPLVFRRAEALGVPLPEDWPEPKRYREARHVDLYQVLTFDGLVKGKRLVEYCAYRGIVVDDPLTNGGAEVGRAIAEGRWDDVVAHCAADVERTRLLAERVLGWARHPEEVAR